MGDFVLARYLEVTVRKLCNLIYIIEKINRRSYFPQAKSIIMTILVVSHKDSCSVSAISANDTDYLHRFSDSLGGFICRNFCWQICRPRIGPIESPLRSLRVELLKIVLIKFLLLGFCFVLMSL